MAEPILAPDEEVTLEPGVHIPMGPVWWRVLDIDTEHMTALLLADELVETFLFDMEQKNVTWENTSLRFWLNSIFPTRFSPQELAAVTECETEPSMMEEFPVTDRFFLLGADEAERYISPGDPSERQLPEWWLRTTYDPHRTFGRSPSGIIQAGFVSRGHVFFELIEDSTPRGVRPACRIDLRAPYFASRIVSGNSDTLRMRIPQLSVSSTHAVRYYGSAERMTLPEGITVLDYDCFRGNDRLQALTLPESLQTIEGHCFDGCFGLKELVVRPNTVSRLSGIDEQTVQRLACGLIAVGTGTHDPAAGPARLVPPGAEEVIVPEGVTKLDTCCFMGMPYLRAVSLPESLQAIGVLAFSGCGSLKEVNLPPLAAAMYPEPGREKVNRLPCALTVVGPGSSDAPFRFFGEGLEEITVPEGVTTLENECFQNLPFLRAVSLPESLQTIGAEVFSGCRSLKEVTLPSRVAAAYPELNREKVTKLSCALTAVGPGSSGAPIRFFGAGAEEITVPEGVTELEPNSFSDMPQLCSVILPSTLRKVGPRAFYGCPMLRTAAVRSAAVEWAPQAILDCPELEIPDAWLCNAGPLPRAAQPYRDELQPKELAFLALFQHGQGWDGRIRKALSRKKNIPVLLPVLHDVLATLPEAARANVRTRWIEYLFSEHPEIMTTEFVNIFCGALSGRTLQDLIDRRARTHDTALLPMLLQYRNTHADNGDPSGGLTL